MKLTQVDLLAEDFSSTIVSKLGDQLKTITRSMDLGSTPSLRLEVMVGASDWEKFEERRVVKLQFDSAPTEVWEVQSVSFERGGDEPRKTVSCRPVWLRLRDQIAYLLLDDGTKDVNLSNTSVDVSTALTRILSSTWQCPSLFEAGNIDAGLFGSTVNTFRSGATHLEHLEALVQDLRAEFEPRWDEANGVYKIDVVERIGDEDASVRTIRETKQSAGEIVNRLRLSGEQSVDRYFSGVVPLGGQDSSTHTMEGARWPIDTVSHDGSAGESTITFADEPVWDDGVLVNAQVTDGNTTHSVVSSTAPDQITVTGDLSGWDTLWFVDSMGDDLITLRDPSAESQIGRRTVTKRFSGVTPFANLLERAGVATAADSTTGWAPIGSNTVVNTVTKDEYVRNGDKSLEVVTSGASDEEGLRTSSFTFDPDELGEVLSAHVSLYVIQGRVQVQLVDSAGDEYPPDETIEGGESTLRGYSISGAKPASGPVFIKVTKLAANTEFVVDAASIVASASARGYSPNMGPRALWRQGARHLLRSGGVPERTFDGQVIDLSELDSIGQELTLGDATTVILHNGTSLEGRITSTERELSVGESTTPLRVQLGEPVNDALDRFFDDPSGTPPPDEGDGTSRVQPVLTDVEMDQTGPTAELTFSVSDPLGVVQKVQARKAVGRNLDENDSYQDLSPSSGSYTETVALTESHNSYIQVKVVTGPQVDDVTREFAFDADQIPDADYQVKWSYNESRSTVEARIVATGGEDTKSYRFGLDPDQDDTDEEIITVDARATTELLNPNVSLSPGSSVDISAKAFSATGQSGNPEPEPFDETFEVPTLDGTESDTRPTINASLDQLDGTPDKGELDFTIDDPDGVLTQVEVRTASGRNLNDSDSYSSLSKTSGTYTAEVDLVEEHTSFIQVRLNLASGLDDVTRTFSFDADRIPAATYTPKWIWNSSRETMELVMVAQGDEDTSSYQFEIDADQDGTIDNTELVDARSTSQLLNPNTPLSPGQALDVTAKAFNQTGQSGNEQSQPYSEELQVPPADQALNPTRPTIEATAEVDSNGDGKVTWTVDDPDGVVSDVETREASGRNLESGDSFTAPEKDSSPYEETVGLSDGHASFIEVRLTTGTGVPTIRRVFTFDLDESPEANYNLLWQWSSARSTAELLVVATGDDDVQSFQFVLDKDQDGTAENTINRDATATTELLNPTTELAAGQTIDIEARAYSEAAQSGEVEDNPLVETIEVPALRGAIAKSRPSINAQQSISSGTAHLQWVVDDPDGVVSDVEVRTVSGQNFDGESFGPPSDDSSPYEETVSLDGKHNSFIEVRLVVSPSGMQNVRQIWSFDADATPEGSIDVSWAFDGGVNGMVGQIAATGDDDVESWEFSITDGANSDTQTVDSQSVDEQQLNTSFSLDPGQEVTITANAYTETGQSGEVKQIVSKTYVVMADVDAITGAGGVTIQGKHILLDGQTSVKGSLDLFPASGFTSPKLKQAVQSGGIVARFTWVNPNASSGNEFTDPLNGKRFKLNSGAQITEGDGPHGLSGYLDGTGPYVACEHELSGPAPNPFSAMWVKLPADQTLSSSNILWSYDASEYYRVYVDGNGILKVEASNLSVTVDSGIDIADGRWYHIQVAFRSNPDTRVLLYINGNLIHNQTYQGDFGSTSNRHPIIGQGSESSTYDGGVGPNDYVEMYFQDFVVGDGHNWDNEEAIPLYSNPDQFMAIGEVHGDLLVDGTVRADKVDTEDLFAQTIQFTGALRQQDNGNTLFAVTAGSNRRVYIADDNGNTTALLSKNGNLSLNKISGYSQTASDAQAGSGEQLPSNVEEYLILSTDNGGRRVPAFLPPDTTEPKAPTGVTAQDHPDLLAIDVDWNAVSDDVNGDPESIDSYAVYRGQSPTDNFTPIGSTDAGTTSYLDGNVSDGQTYYYKVSAIDDAGNESALSSYDSATAVQEDKQLK